MKSTNTTVAAVLSALDARHAVYDPFQTLSTVLSYELFYPISVELGLLARVFTALLAVSVLRAQSCYASTVD